VLDGAAYWPGGRDAFLHHFGQSRDACFERYRSVLHLQSLAESHPHLYGTEGNAIRYEPLLDAVHIERAVRAAWEGHPGLIVISGAMDLEDKIARTLAHVRSLLSMSSDGT
jgi:hypothetical protein